MPQKSPEELDRLNAELHARVAELTQALAQSQAFARLHASVVHDLRNAFHVTLMAAETLNQTLDLEEDRELANTIVSAAEHGASLARDLLALARNEDVETTIVNGADVLERVQRLIQRFSREAIVCTFDAEPGGWSVRVERPKLEAALINFCVNARDAMPHGGTLRVGVRNLRNFVPVAMLPRDDYVEFSVSDTGSGMSADVLGRATEAFFTTKETTGGTGLGLAMAETFASRAGGALAIDSEPGRGTTVRLVLPRNPTPLEAIDADPSARAKLDKILRSIRTPELRQAFQDWRALCPVHGLPRLVAAERQLESQADNSLVLTVESEVSPPMLRLMRIGRTLEHALGRRQVDDFKLDGSLAVGTLAAAYRRTFHSRFPSYEYASYSFEENEPEVFERLILPAATDGRTVTHLVGLIRLSESMNFRGKPTHVETE